MQHHGVFDADAAERAQQQADNHPQPYPVNVAVHQRIAEWAGVAESAIGYAGMKDGDGLLMFNYRSDRAREILTALLDPRFDGFNRNRVAAFGAAVGMVEYSAALNPFLKTLFPPAIIKMGLGETISKAGLKQLRIAETEKYAHVTFFFNGGEERVFDGEERILVPSPKVQTYDLKPEMSAPEVTDKLVEAIGSGNFDLIVTDLNMSGTSGFDLADPARPFSRLGEWDAGKIETVMDRISGFMIHYNCENADFDLFDLNRVETLRGPQGTLFGSGSVGGTVRYITNQPKLGVTEGAVEANLNLIDGGDVGGHLKGAVNVPLSDMAAVRTEKNAL